MDPAVQGLALRGAKGAMKMMGRSRRRRGRRGQWYLGKRLGIPSDFRISARTPGDAPVNRANPSTVQPGRMQIVQKRELLLDLTTSATANAYAGAYFVINPAEAGTFPSLANIAEQFQKATFTSLKLEYVGECPTSTAGTIGMNVVADCQAVLPSTFEELASAAGARTVTSWSSLMFPVDLKNMIQLPAGNLVSAPLTPSPANADRFSSMGTILIGYTGAPASTKVGKIYVHYTVRLSDPIARPFRATHVSYHVNNVGAGAGDVNFNNNFTGFLASILQNKHPIVLDAASTGIRRRISGSRMLLKVTATAVGLNPLITVTDNGVAVVPYTNSDTADVCTRVFLVPAGSVLSRIQVNVNVAWTNINFLAIAH